MLRLQSDRVLLQPLVQHMVGRSTLQQLVEHRVGMLILELGRMIDRSMQSILELMSGMSREYKLLQRPKLPIDRVCTELLQSMLELMIGMSREYKLQ